jgi:DNA-binding CsgD family transcriptional regulator
MTLTKNKLYGKPLTKREKEVFAYLSEGKQYSQIAIYLYISTETVRTHANKIYRKLGVRNRTEAINKFYGKG